MTNLWEDEKQRSHPPFYVLRRSIIRVHRRSCLAAHSRLPECLKLRDAVLYLEDCHVGTKLACFDGCSDILVSVSLVTLELITICTFLVRDTHLVVTHDLPGERSTKLRRDKNPFAVGTEVFDDRNLTTGAPERFV